MDISSRQSIFFFWTVVAINGDRWYQATVIESNDIPLRDEREMQKTINQKQSRLMEYLLKTNNFIENPRIQPHRKELINTEKIFELKGDNITKNTDKVKIVLNRKKESGTQYATRPRLAKTFDLNETSKPRFFEVINMVEIDHVLCTSSDGLEGICVHDYECESSGGTDMGECADGCGTCCVTQFACDGNYSELLEWFTNPGFPSPSSERLACTFSINKASDDIKQLRVDFKYFELLQPSRGICEQDQLIISGQNINSVIPILCGINTGQHVYVEVGHVNGPFYFTIQTIASASRLFSVKITQLTENDEMAAPSGCLQYFKQTEGYIQSFNYFDNSELSVKRTPNYLNNLNYAICIERATECCSVTYSNSGNMQIINYDTDGLPVIPPNQAGVKIFNCPGDWLLIAATRLCGDRFNDGSILEDFSYNAPVWLWLRRYPIIMEIFAVVFEFDTSAGPIVVWFRSDIAYVGRGFKLEYQQNHCSNYEK